MAERFTGFLYVCRLLVQMTKMERPCAFWRTTVLHKPARWGSIASFLHECGVKKDILAMRGRLSSRNFHISPSLPLGVVTIASVKACSLPVCLG